MSTDGEIGNEKISADLARANLLRMRGDHKGAIDQCLSVLKRAPENVDAHMLIAEIYEETGDPGQAAQWYELALDLEPKSESIKLKVNALTEETRARETAGTSRNLTLPPEKPPTALYIGIIAAIALVVGFGAYLSEGRGLGLQKANVAIVPPADGTSVPIVAPEEDPKPNVKDESVGISETSLPEDDRTLMRTLAEAVPSGATLVAAFQDPRTNELTLTYSVTPEVHEPTVAAEGARSSLGKVLSATAAVVRVAKGGKLTYVATIERARLAETETATWRQANTASDAWLRHVLQQEWGTPSLNTPATGETGGTATPAPTGP